MAEENKEIKEINNEITTISEIFSDEKSIDRMINEAIPDGKHTAPPEEIPYTIATAPHEEKTSKQDEENSIYIEDTKKYNGDYSKRGCSLKIKIVYL